MGKIIRNGIEFCGTSDTADNIIYDNKDSGLESTTTQGAIDELSEKVKSGGNIEYLTQAQYDALPDDKLTNGVEYRITDAGTMAGAENVGYNNSKSGLEAVNVQDAIDKIDENLEEKGSCEVIAEIVGITNQQFNGIDLSKYSLIGVAMTFDRGTLSCSTFPTQFLFDRFSTNGYYTIDGDNHAGIKQVSGDLTNASFILLLNRSDNQYQSFGALVFGIK